MKLHYVHNYVGAEEFHVVSKVDVPEGKVELRYEFETTGGPDLKKGKGSPGKAQLYINRKLVGQLSLPYTVPLALGIGSGIFVGRNSGSPVTSLYGPPFEFTGTIFQVTRISPENSSRTRRTKGTPVQRWRWRGNSKSKVGAAQDSGGWTGGRQGRPCHRSEVRL
jgi:hypothetical protein